MSQPVAVLQDLWFLNTRVIVRIGNAQNADGLSVLEHHAPYGDSPPLHIHRAEDEVFHLIDGTLRLQIGTAEIHARSGDTVLAPQGVAHTYRVESPEGARWLTVTRGGFEGMVRSVARPAGGTGLPHPAGAPTPEQVQQLAAVCARHGIDLVGPPLR